MHILIITAVMMWNGPAVDVHSIEFETLERCEEAKSEWLKNAEYVKKRSSAICVRK